QVRHRGTLALHIGGLVLAVLGVVGAVLGLLGTREVADLPGAPLLGAGAGLVAVGLAALVAARLWRGRPAQRPAAGYRETVPARRAPARRRSGTGRRRARRAGRRAAVAGQPRRAAGDGVPRDGACPGAGGRARRPRRPDHRGARPAPGAACRPREGCCTARLSAPAVHRCPPGAPARRRHPASSGSTAGNRPARARDAPMSDSIQITVRGRVGTEPDLLVTANGREVTRFRLGATRSYRDATG